MAATGGTPAYTWSITAGALPSGLTIGASTGIISGAPTASGTDNFTATVADNNTPSQTVSAATSIVVASVQSSGPGTTWYVRPDVAPSSNPNVPSAQSTCKFNASSPATPRAPPH